MTQIADGYAVQGRAVELGALIVNGVVDAKQRIRIPLASMNRHGLIAGATGTGKTKTMQLIAEQLSDAGVPILMADIKGDMSGLNQPGVSSDKIMARSNSVGDDWVAQGFPVQFLSLGETGVAVPVRATITDFGAILLSKVLELNAVQESTLGLIFHWAKQSKLPLATLKDLRAVIVYLISDEGKSQLREFGGVSAATAGVILRSLLNLEAEGADSFFGEPAFNPQDLLRLTDDGRGVISLLELGTAEAMNPVLFSTFLMWVLSDLFKRLPEVGDIDKPKLVFVIDEAHLLFADASKAFLRLVEQTVKLIRSKGVGVFFCTQLPTDIPSSVLSQLGARIQHALRVFTPTDFSALTKVVKTFPTADYDLGAVLTSLGIGEAILTVLSEQGVPTPVAHTQLRAPRSLMGAIGDDAIHAAAVASRLYVKYGRAVQNLSANDILTCRSKAVRVKPWREFLANEHQHNPAYLGRHRTDLERTS